MVEPRLTLSRPVRIPTARGGVCAACMVSRVSLQSVAVQSGRCSRVAGASRAGMAMEEDLIGRNLYARCVASISHYRSLQ